MNFKSFYLFLLLCTITIKARASNCETTIILTTQNEVDSFRFLGCDTITYLYIQGNNIVNLDSLIYLKHIKEDLRIENTWIESLSGLDSLKSVGSWLSIQNCPMVKNLIGVNQMDSLYGLDIRYCPSFDSIVFNSPTFLQRFISDYNDNVIYIDVGNTPNTSANRFAGFSISFNNSLQSIKVFTNAVHINNNSIDNNPRLKTIHTYNNMVQSGGIHVSFNDSITELVCYPVLRLQMSQFVITSNNILAKILIPKAKQLSGCFISQNPYLNDCCFLLNGIVFLDGLELSGNGNDCNDLAGIINYCDGMDPDGDNIQGSEDNCPFLANSTQADFDLDGVGNDCDNCPSEYNPDQFDSNQNGIGDVCDFDTQGKIGLHTDTPLAGVHIDSSDVYIGEFNRGLILRNFLGRCYRISVDDKGQIRTKLIDCPQ